MLEILSITLFSSFLDVVCDEFLCILLEDIINFINELIG